MRVTKVAVTIGLTENLGNYNNFRPEVRLEAELEEGDSYINCMAVLANEARAKVHAETDAMLMIHGEEPRYYEGPRYTARSILNYQAIVVYPSDCWTDIRTYTSIIKHRYPLDRLLGILHAEQRAAKAPYTIHQCFTQDQLNTTVQRLHEDYEAACAAAGAERAAQESEATHAEHPINDESWGDEDEFPDADAHNPDGDDQPF